MKRIAILALIFIVAGSIMTGCRRNDMQDTGSSDGMGGNTTITTVPDVTILPTAASGAPEGSIGTNPADGNTGNEDAMRGGIAGPGR